MSATNSFYDIKIVTPQELILSDKAKYVSLPTLDGLVEILPDHAPLICGLMEGTIKISTEEKELSYNIGKGMANMANNSLTILLESASS